MKKLLVLLFVFIGFKTVYAQKIEPKPNPPVAVNDFANLLETFQQQALEQKLEAYNDSTSSAIVIITVPSLNGYDIEQVALKYLRDWGIGTKEKNNGVVILVSAKDHKARIETGYGMEGVLPDILAKQIIDERMIPFFKNGDYYAGLNNAVDAIIQAAAGEYKADQTDKGNSKVTAGKIIPLIIIFLVIVFLFSGRGGGGGGGSYMSRRGSRSFLGNALPWFLLGDMMGGGGRRGGGFGGGGFGGGGFGGGGFGGFGGGSGGGGGASGGW